jgi:hypothetical protein
MSEGNYSEEELARIEAGPDPEALPELVRTIRRQQRDLDSLRLSMEVARRDREELRAALLLSQEELRRLREELGAREPLQ